MIKSYVGIDLGTSSVKVIVKSEDGVYEKVREGYEENSPEGFFDAVIKALKKLKLSSVCAIGLSSQVGSYIVNDSEFIPWNDTSGEAELKALKSEYSNEVFIDEISMPHPSIISYPIPRLKYIQKMYGPGAVVCQPKDYIIKRLTGSFVTDKFSWRGLANIENNSYSEFFLKETGNPKLPEIIDFTDKAGTITDDICDLTGLPQNTPVYTGLNDYFSSLLGMGIFDIGSAFDITGTSEHMGVIESSVAKDTNMVSGPYIKNFVHYGVTASSGVSLKFGIDNFELEKFSDFDECTVRNSPIFTPYLAGERAPIFDSNATGMFFGITKECTKKHLAYSVLEGVAFSIYHIYEQIGSPCIKDMVVSGGASENDVLNRIKACIFNVPLVIPEEIDTSALGALITAASGFEKCFNIERCAERFCRVKQIIKPDTRLRTLLLRRFEIYKELYPSLKDTGIKLKEALK